MGIIIIAKYCCSPSRWQQEHCTFIEACTPPRSWCYCTWRECRSGRRRRNPLSGRVPILMSLRRVWGIRSSWYPLLGGDRQCLVLVGKYILAAYSYLSQHINHIRLLPMSYKSGTSITSVNKTKLLEYLTVYGTLIEVISSTLIPQPEIPSFFLPSKASTPTPKTARW